MAVPRNRASNARKNLKRSHHAKKHQHLAKCPNCGASLRSHCACLKCGHYNNRMVLPGNEA